MTSAKFYASKSIAKYFQHELSKTFIKSELNVKHVPNGVIAIGSRMACSFGVLTDKGVFVKESVVCHRKGSGRITRNYIPPALPDTYPVFNCDAVYLGDITSNAFGHHLLENWNRAYAFLDEKYRDMKFVLLNSKRLETIPEFIAELARFLGISAENFVILNETAGFRNVYIPEQGFMIKTFSTKKFSEIYTKTADSIESKFAFDKIYVSRAMLKLRKTYGEEKVQRIFEKNGYHIIYPELLSLEEQIALMKNCKSLAGCAGTALHLSLFMPNGGAVIQIKKNKLKDDNCATQYLLTESKGQNLILIEGSIEKIKTKHSYPQPQIIGVNEHLKRFFDDSGFNYSSDDIAFDKQSYEEYIKANEDFFAQSRRTGIETKLLEIIVKIISCFVPDRLHRVAFRDKMRIFFGIM